MGDCNQNETDEAPFSQRPIVILGAGIIGCAAARQLLLKGFPVVLVAEYLPGDQSIYYASAWAGAAWHAAGGITPDQRYLQVVTHRILLKMAQDGPEAGVSIVNAREYLEQQPTPDSAIWGKTVVSKFHEMKPGEYPPEFHSAWAYETLVTDPTRHMPYLKQQIEHLGGQFIRQRVDSLQELYGMFPESRVFINASGWGSKALTDVQDESCFPERGQNVFLTTDRCDTMYFRNGKEYTYIIPRPLSKGIVLGGVKQQGNLSPEVDMEIARDEIARAHRLAPEIVPEHPAPDTVSHIIGIRPSRKGGFRLDSERKGSRVILSAYGFGGGGYAFSYGIADALVKMVETAERENVV
ncbi:D-amino-acid oxidase [Penicillium bovifimosum]|uniref:D-amino-acid oxidase n=1 Tax=Penicillium bovifimosum TaxID=126998 RepID=A0A9W9GLI7_9EURO|nr:D-amino-acid oxidase [Penicillium bovifimosum]KAJ5123811.1 D-amino-acid oxidase [Penicillium bovifimosum]